MTGVILFEDPYQPPAPFPGAPAGDWRYRRVSLLGFPADTVAEVSTVPPGSTDGRAVFELLMTDANGAFDANHKAAGIEFLYGQCSNPNPPTVTVRGPGFSVMQQMPKPPACP